MKELLRRRIWVVPSRSSLSTSGMPDSGGDTEEFADMTTEEKVLADIRAHPGTIIAEMALRLKTSRPTLHTHLAILERLKKVYVYRRGTFKQLYASRELRDEAVRSRLK